MHPRQILRFRTGRACVRRGAIQPQTYLKLAHQVDWPRPSATLQLLIDDAASSGPRCFNHAHPSLFSPLDSVSATTHEPSSLQRLQKWMHLPPSPRFTHVHGLPKTAELARRIPSAVDYSRVVARHASDVQSTGQVIGGGHVEKLTELKTLFLKSSHAS